MAAIAFGCVVLLVLAILLIDLMRPGRGRPGGRTRPVEPDSVIPVAPAPPPPPAPAAPTSPPAAPQVDRRISPRAGAAYPVLVRRGSPASHPTRSFAMDLSAAGVLVAGPADLDVGEPVWLTLDLGDAVPLDTPATVVRETRQGYKGLRFEDPDRRVAARVQQYVRDRS